MFKDDWFQAIEQSSETARFFMQADVIDIKFDSGHSWEVYVAISADDKRHGLRGLKSLDVDGMLFYFENPSSTPFTMEGMSMDLDVAWFDETGTLLHHESVEKDHPYPLLCDKPFSYVLESRRGSFGPTNLVI